MQVKILGGRDIHVKEGSMVTLKCVITNIVEKPPYVTWYLNNKVLDITVVDSVDTSV